MPKLRANDLAISPDGERLVVVSESTIIVYDFHSYEILAQYHVDGGKLTSVNISADSQTMLVSIDQNRLHLMDIETLEILQRYEGHVQKQFIIRSGFGGADQNFVVSGSEGKFYSCITHVEHWLMRAIDSRIYIWHNNGLLIEALDGHVGCVNSIAWHPTDPTVFASAGDDKKVKIWRPANAPPLPLSSTSASAPSNGYNSSMFMDGR